MLGVRREDTDKMMRLAPVQARGHVHYQHRGHPFCVLQKYRIIMAAETAHNIIINANATTYIIF